jgi:hypothetical protein
MIISYIFNAYVKTPQGESTNFDVVLDDKLSMAKA